MIKDKTALFTKPQWLWVIGGAFVIGLLISISNENQLLYQGKLATSTSPQQTTAIGSITGVELTLERKSIEVDEYTVIAIEPWTNKNFPKSRPIDEQEFRLYVGSAVFVVGFAKDVVTITEPLGKITRQPKHRISIVIPPNPQDHLGIGVIKNAVPKTTVLPTAVRATILDDGVETPVPFAIPLPKELELLLS